MGKKIRLRHLHKRTNPGSAPWYPERVDRFRENRIFQSNQRQFYSELNQEGEIFDDDQPHEKVFGKHIQ